MAKQIITESGTLIVRDKDVKKNDTPEQSAARAAKSKQKATADNENQRVAEGR